jgi:hypothetical protein
MQQPIQQQELIYPIVLALVINKNPNLRITARS